MHDYLKGLNLRFLTFFLQSAPSLLRGLIFFLKEFFFQKMLLIHPLGANSLASSLNLTFWGF